MTAKVHAISGTNVFAQFEHTIAHRFAVTEDTRLQSIYPVANFGLR